MECSQMEREREDTVGGKKKNEEARERREGTVCVCKKGTETVNTTFTLCKVRDVVYPPRLSDLVTIFLRKAMISDHQTRNTEEQQCDSSLPFIFKNSHAAEFKPPAAFLLRSWQHHWQWEKLVENVKRRQANIKESIILMDLVSKAITSTLRELMNDGGKETPAFKWKKII